MQKIQINTSFIKLDSFLKYCSLVSSGGQAKQLIENGEVLVNKEKCLMRGKKLKHGDIVQTLNQTFIIEKV